MDIYRIEHGSCKGKDGEPHGPYHATCHADVKWDDMDPETRAHIDLSLDVCSELCDWDRPAPASDFEIQRNIRPEERCGFATVEQLKRWFGTDFRRRLHEDGYVMAHYKVAREYATVGETQALFIYEYSKRIKTLPLDF